MVIIGIKEGLGNQMSQYAFGRLLALKYRKTVKYDISFYDCHKVHQGFELQSIFPDLAMELASKYEIFTACHMLPRGHSRVMNKLAQAMEKLFLHSRVYYQEFVSGYPVDTKVVEPGFDNIYVDGVFHNYDYSEIIQNLRCEFRFKPLDSRNLQMKEEMEESQSVSIHIRRGDYVGLGLNVVPIEYYKDAIAYISAHVESPRFFVFSDDIDWVKDTLPFIPSPTFVNWNIGTESYKDMQLMSCCKHNIIANSTFSYWGAMLNANADKIVIKPRMQTRTRETWKTPGWIKM